MSRVRPWVFAILIVALLIGAYAAAGFLGVPYIARTRLIDFVRQHYGRQLQIGQIHFNPFTLTLEVTQLRMPDADTQTLIAFERLHVDLRFASLWHLAPVFHQIALDQPYVRLVLRQNGGLNLADLGQGFASPPPNQPPSQPLKLTIERFNVTGGSTNFEDRSRPEPFRAEFKPINFELRDFSTVGGNGSEYSLTAASPEGERLTWNGTLQLNPVKSRGVFELQNLAARTLWNYVQSSVPFEIDSGIIGIKGKYDLAAEQGLALGVDLSDTTISHLAVKPKQSADHYVQIENIAVTGTQIDLSRHAVVVSKVLVSGGDIKVWMNEHGQLNLLELAPGSATAPTPPPGHRTRRIAAKLKPSSRVVASAPAATQPAPAAADAWRIESADIALQGMKIEAEDRSMKPAVAWTVSPLNVHVLGFTTAAADTLDVALDTGINTSGKLNARVKVTPDSGALSGHVETSGLALPWLQPYLSHYTSMTLLKGVLGTHLDLERHADGFLQVKGDAEVTDLRTVDNALKQDFVKWKQLRVAQVLYRSHPQSLHIGSITATDPYARMVIAPDRTTNISAVLRAPGAAPPAPAASTTAAAPPPAQRRTARSNPTRATPAVAVATAPAAPLTPFPTSIGLVRLINGTADYADLWIKPSFSIGIQALNGTVKGLSSDPNSRAQIQLDGKVDRYSPLSISGSANLLSAALFTDITMSFKDLDLPVVNPYSGYFAGYKIDKGKLSVDVHYQIDRRQLNAAQHFVVDQLELGEHVDSPEAMHVPLKLAVALLKDRHGVIDLNLPMNGSLDDPKFRIGPIIWKIFLNLIAKAVTAPFALLGHLFGGGEHPNIVSFAAGSPELDKPAQEQLSSLAKALEERPGLKLDVPIVAAPAVDGPILIEKEQHDSLLARAQATKEGQRSPGAAEAMLADPKQLFKLLQAQYTALLPPNTPLPASTVAIQQAKRGHVPPLEPAIADLKAAILAHAQPDQAELDALGKARAKAIEDALLAGGQIDPGRVFVVNTPAKPQSGAKVAVEMALK